MVEEIELVSKKHPELFHYTTLGNFKNICKSRQFWATHYADMNDSSELSRFRLKLQEFITPVVRNIFDNRIQSDAQFSAQVGKVGGIDAVVHQEATMHIHNLHENTFGERGMRETFICSFCTHTPEFFAHNLELSAARYATKHGLLSQWRGYGKGGGVAIVLDTKGVEDQMAQEFRAFAHPINNIIDVCYDDNSDLIKKEFHKVFERLPESICKWYKGEREPPPGYEDILQHFIFGSTAVKHHSFREEAEVRIVVSPTPTNPKSYFYKKQGNSKRIKFRLKGESEVRYIELFGDAQLPIKRVIVGPSRIQHFNYQEVQEVVAGLGIEVIMSETPFLG